MLPELIGRARLVEGNSKLQAGTALAGATLVSFSNRRWGVGPTMVWGAMVAAVGGVGYAVLPPHPIVAIALLLMANLLMSGGTMLVYVNSMSVRQTLSPASLLGRVNGTMRTLSWGMQPLGALVGGLSGQMIGLRPTLLVGAFGIIGATLLLVGSPLRLVREPGTLTTLGQPTFVG